MPNNSVCQVMTEILRSMHLTSMQLVTMDEQITAMNAVVAACERLYKQPIPVAYTRYGDNAHGSCRSTAQKAFLLSLTKQ